jgi:hypothetical protein
MTPVHKGEMKEEQEKHLREDVETVCQRIKNIQRKEAERTGQDVNHDTADGGGVTLKSKDRMDIDNEQGREDGDDDDEDDGTTPAVANTTLARPAAIRVKRNTLLQRIKDVWQGRGLEDAADAVPYLMRGNFRHPDDPIQ